jgi:hypothetical protein
LLDVLAREFGGMPPTADDIAKEGYFFPSFAATFAHEAGVREWRSMVTP